jgi:hypothetical protein
MKYRPYSKKKMKYRPGRSVFPTPTRVDPRSARRRSIVVRVHARRPWHARWQGEARARLIFTGEVGHVQVVGLLPS